MIFILPKNGVKSTSKEAEVLAKVIYLSAYFTREIDSDYQQQHQHDRDSVHNSGQV